MRARDRAQSLTTLLHKAAHKFFGVSFQHAVNFIEQVIYSGVLARGNIKIFGGLLRLGFFTALGRVLFLSHDVPHFL